MLATDLNIPAGLNVETILGWMTDTEEVFAQKIVGETLYLVTEDEGNYRLYRIWNGGISNKTQVSVDFNATDAKAAIRELFRRFTNATEAANAPHVRSVYED